MTDAFPELDFETVEDTAPKSSKKNPFFNSGPKAKKEKKAFTTPPASQAEKLCEPLGDMYRFAGMGLAMVDQPCGLALAQNADTLGASWVELAKTSPSFRRFLARAQQASGWGTVVAAHIPLAMAVIGHHMPEMLGYTNEEKESDREAQSVG